MSRTVGTINVLDQLNITGATFYNGATITVPTVDTTLVGTNTTDTLTNKTLTAPAIASIANGGTITVPTGTDTLVARDTTDTLTNKTIAGATNDVEANTLRGAAGWTVPVAGASPATGYVFTFDGTDAVFAAPAQTLLTAQAQTSDAVVTTLQTLATTTDRVHYANAVVQVRNTASTAEAAAFDITAAFVNDAGTVTQLATTDKLAFVAAGLTWTAQFAVSGTNVLLQIVGEAAKTLQWNTTTTFQISSS
jgi:hypothetical protein